MNIIPVIDLKEGLVVSAQQGNRDNYLPINSTLCASSLIEDILESFLSIYPFKTLYIADLNAITKTGNNQPLINKVVNQYPAIEFWVDNGKKIEDLSVNTEFKYKPIIGTESQHISNFQTEFENLENTILSLDFFPETGYRGSTELIENSTLWPQHIIIMTLERVGKDAGPDIDRLSHFSRKYPEKNFVAAGGIRNESDLQHLKKIGINHALVATALHSGVINTEIINKLQTKKCPDSKLNLSQGIL